MTHITKYKFFFKLLLQSVLPNKPNNSYISVNLRAIITKLVRTTKLISVVVAVFRIRGTTIYSIYDQAS
jgi:hypothetical protein